MLSSIVKLFALNIPLQFLAYVVFGMHSPYHFYFSVFESLYRNIVLGLFLFNYFPLIEIFYSEDKRRYSRIWYIHSILVITHLIGSFNVYDHFFMEMFVFPPICFIALTSLLTISILKQLEHGQNRIHL